MVSCLPAQGCFRKAASEAIGSTPGWRTAARNSKIFPGTRPRVPTPNGCWLAAKSSGANVTAGAGMMLQSHLHGNADGGARRRPGWPPINRRAASVHAAVFASALRIAVAPHAELILPDIGTAVGLPLLLARTRLGELLLGW